MPKGQFDRPIYQRRNPVTHEAIEPEIEHNWGIGLNDCFEHLDTETRQSLHEVILSEPDAPPNRENIREINKILQEEGIRWRRRKRLFRRLVIL